MLAQQFPTQLPTAVQQQLRLVGSHTTQAAAAVHLVVRRMTWPLVKEAVANAMARDGDVEMSIGSDVARAAEAVAGVGKVVAAGKAAKVAAPGVAHVTENMAKVMVVGPLKTALMKLSLQRPQNRRLLQDHSIFSIERCTAGRGGTEETVRNLPSAGDVVAQQAKQIAASTMAAQHAGLEVLTQSHSCDNIRVAAANNMAAAHLL
mmetsp:Transcript_57310/g.113871  ORF Transcript_57310/g.113871 Transcript_57310/m.113871 type:complete len:205 (+) Transcript_57310:1777-2391(+)